MPENLFTFHNYNHESYQAYFMHLVSMVKHSHKKYYFCRVLWPSISRLLNRDSK